MLHAVVRVGAPLLFLLPLFAVAQPLPRPAEFYFDEDALVARRIIVAEGDDEAVIARLIRLRERGGRNAERAVAQLAHLAMASGRAETGKALYAQARQMTTEGGWLAHSLAWNLGWDLFRLGEIEAALAQWAGAVSDRGAIQPAWAPPTLALALWRLDRRSEAVIWYAAAVRTWPDRWQDPAGLATQLPDWREDELAVLSEVLAAWREDPPAWP